MSDWLRAPLLDKRIAHGAEFAGDAWKHRVTGEIRYVVVGERPRDDGTYVHRLDEREGDQ